MHFACPACARSYALDPARIGPEGRKVRCAACRESWFVAPSTPETLSADLDLPAYGPALTAGLEHPSLAIEIGEPSDIEFVVTDADPIVIEPDRHETPRVSRAPKIRSKAARGRRPGKPKRPGAALHRLAAAAILLLAVGLPAGILFRTAIVRALPGTGALFATIGLPVNVLGLRLVDVVSSLSRETGAPVLVVSGRIANPTSAPIGVPPLELTIEGEQGEVLYSWSTAAPNQDLEGGAETTFRAPLASPPPAGRRVRVVFREGAHAGRVASR